MQVKRTHSRELVTQFTLDTGRRGTRKYTTLQHKQCSRRGTHAGVTAEEGWQRSTSKRLMTRRSVAPRARPPTTPPTPARSGLGHILAI
jgi:hypothetical protein